MKAIVSTALALCASLTLPLAAEKPSKADKADKGDKKAEASGASSSSKIADLKVGTLITGPEVTTDDLKGKAVVLEFWGVNCGPCLASLPDMEKLSRRNKGDLVMIGCHCQNATDDEVKAVVKKNRLSYSIVKDSSRPSSFSGIPHAYVFNAEGRILFDGNPHDKDFDKAVRDAVKSAKEAAKATASVK